MAYISPIQGKNARIQVVGGSLNHDAHTDKQNHKTRIEVIGVRLFSPPLLAELVLLHEVPAGGPETRPRAAAAAASQERGRRSLVVTAFAHPGGRPRVLRRHAAAAAISNAAVPVPQPVLRLDNGGFLFVALVVVEVFRVPASVRRCGGGEGGGRARQPLVRGTSPLSAGTAVAGTAVASVAVAATGVLGG